jgi:CRISPR-associated protein Csb2
MPGSLDSLKARHEAAAKRFTTEGKGRKAVTLFRQPPKARFRTIAYDRAPALLMLELRRADDPTLFHAVPQMRAADLAARVRDLAAARLLTALPSRKAEIERVVIGRNAEDAASCRCRASACGIPIPASAECWSRFPRIARFHATL